jgi:predicted nuclease with TOPRIM domain
VDEGNARIGEQEEKIRQLLKESGNSAAANKKLRAELQELKRLRDEYLERIDKLLTENTELRERTRTLDSTVAALKTQRGTLEAKVSIASIPRAEYMNVTALKKRNNGRYSETSLARRTNRIDLCFQLLANRAAEPGEKAVYIRIISPDEKVLGNRSTGSSSFMEAETNEELLYTARKEIDYRYANQEVCLFYEEEEDKTFVPGQYVAEVYVDGYLSGKGVFTLR